MKKIVKMQQESRYLMIFNQGFILQADFVLCWHYVIYFLLLWIKSKKKIKIVGSVYMRVLHFY